jgi:AraC-like DNA-binding protein
MAFLVPSAVMEGVAGLIEQAGRDPAEIAGRVGIPVTALYASDILISPVKYNDLLELAAIECKDRFLGLKIACLQSLDILGAVWLMARLAKTVGEQIQLIAENMALHTDTMALYISSDNASGKLIVYEIQSPAKAGSPNAPVSWSPTQATEMALAYTCNEFRYSLGRQWVPDYVQFRHAPPDNMRPLHDFFGHRIFFNQDVNAIHVTNEDFSQPNRRHPEGAISSEAIARNKRELESTVGLGSSFTGRVSRIIRLLINDKGCTASEVACLLSLPERTLRYRLKQNKTSYQALYDNARQDIAKTYLVNSDLSISAIAERLHFTDTAAFSNFFKRRTGEPPRNYAKTMRRK